MKKSATLLILFSVFNSSLSAQDDDPGFEITAGIEVRALLNPGILNVDSVVLIDPDNNFRGVYENSGGFGFGGVIRMRFTKLINLETGLYYTRRVYDYRITDLVNGFQDATSFRVIGYEIPIKALVYIRMDKRIYMNVALGYGMNFVASDVIALEQIYNLKAFKAAFLQSSVLGNVGAEYRTEKDGYFYLGFGINQTFNDLMITEANYFREGVPPAYRQRGPLSGSYISVDFKYFFPMAKPKKEVRYVVPDWKRLGK